MKKSINRSSCIAWLAALYPLGLYYGKGSLNISILAFIFLLMYTLLKEKVVKTVYPSILLAYILYYVMTRFLYDAHIGKPIAFSIMFAFLIWGYLNYELKINTFLHAYRIITFVNIIFLVIQEILYYILGYRIIGIMTFLPLTLGDESFDPEFYANAAEMATRSSAFFSEPAHLAQYLLPLLAIELFFVCTRKAYLRSIIYIVALIILASGNALLGLLIIGCFYIFKILKKCKSYISIPLVTLIITISIFSYEYIASTEYGKKMIERTDELDTKQTSASSGFIRIFRGYYIWMEMNDVEKIFGINSIDRIKEKINSCEVADMFGENDIYLNGIQSIIIYTGYIGLMLFSFIIMWLWKDNNIAGRCCIAINILLHCIAAVYMSYISILYFAIALLMKKEQKRINAKTLILSIKGNNL